MGSGRRESEEGEGRGRWVREDEGKTKGTERFEVDRRKGQRNGQIETEEKEKKGWRLIGREEGTDTEWRERRCPGAARGKLSGIQLTGRRQRRGGHDTTWLTTFI